MGLGAAALPLFHHDRRARAATASGFPKRLVVIMICNGTIAENYWPNAKREEKDFTWGSILRPLDDATRRHGSLKSKLNLIGGLEYTSAADDERENKNPTGNSHNTPCHMLTGTNTLHAETGDRVVANGMSVDQYIANAIMKTSPTKLKSLHIGLPGIGDPFQQLVSYNGPAISTKGKGTDDCNRPELDPGKVYQTLFADVGVDPGQLALARARKKSLLDFISGDLNRMSKNLGSEDKQKVEVHLNAIRQIETGLDSSVVGCSPPPAPTGKFETFWGSEKSQAQNESNCKLLATLAASAMGCDLTRVVTFMLPADAGASTFSFPWLGGDFMKPATEFYSKYINYHQLAHHQGDPVLRPLRIRAEQWFHEMFAYFLEAMMDQKEGDGTMLDNSMVVLMNSGSEGASHAIRGVPTIVAGSAGGYFKTGRYVKLGDWGSTNYNRATRYVPHNGLLVSMANAMDVPIAAYPLTDKRYGGEITALRG
jgi:hypothetical protein